MPTPALARRFQLKPLRPPNYKIKDVPYYNDERVESRHAKEHLSTSSTSKSANLALDETLVPTNVDRNDCLSSPASQVFYTNNRDVLQESMAEMVLLTNEVMRRNKLKFSRANHDSPAAPAKLASKPLSLEYMADRLDVDDPLHAYLVRTSAGGMLQGFITLTTFTNWQSSFEWDSTHPRAFEYGTRSDAVVDSDGRLSRELQQTVRCGDVYNEGIVWPRIAEISLLGALGCGRLLVKLAIEMLEGLPAANCANYDYVVLQATENSIKFYEKMGFVRVGAVSEVKDEPLNSSNNNEDRSEIISSPVKTWLTDKHGITLREVAAKFNVEVWDLIFFNHYSYPGILPGSKLKKGTELFIPQINYYSPENSDNEKEHDTSKESYMHWQFPDEPNHEPSYMMVRKLNRVKRAKTKDINSLFTSLSHPVVTLPTVTPPSSDTSPSKSVSQEWDNQQSHENEKPNLTKAKKRKLEQCHPDQPKRPKKPLTPFFLFSMEQRKANADGLPKSVTEANKILSQKWRALPIDERQQYEAIHEKSKTEYKIEMQVFNAKLEEFFKNNPSLMPEASSMTSKSKKYKGEKKQRQPKLFNKVVSIDPDDTPYGDKYKYYYVLTYLPDLQWCHLCPMTTRGKFEESGRDKYVLVNEDEESEIDLTAAACSLVKARAMRRTQDADKEEWDIEL